MVTKSTFDSSYVVRFLGITESALHAWIARGVVQLPQGTPGTGRAREYSDVDIARLTLMKALADEGIDLALAFKLTEITETVWGQESEHLHPKTTVRPRLFVGLKSAKASMAVPPGVNDRYGRTVAIAMTDRDLLAYLGSYGGGQVYDLARFFQAVRDRISQEAAS